MVAVWIRAPKVMCPDPWGVFPNPRLIFGPVLAAFGEPPNGQKYQLVWRFNPRLIDP